MQFVVHRHQGDGAGVQRHHRLAFLGSGLGQGEGSAQGAQFRRRGQRAFVARENRHQLGAEGDDMGRAEQVQRVARRLLHLPHQLRHVLIESACTEPIRSAISTIAVE
ncbi:hypothetical protein HK414_18180 [Ramlibacter terrae]|uniref:Uncharacterized protein n=1 Tax=Ramlibacter terrae TaxID=2732511 RepID=A0ABX6P428_9BURK|nr:hypothetical protein HK414_18180 [Ramlibacter terrae]